MSDIDETIQFRRIKEELTTPRDILISVYHSLLEKGYDPINQIVGYLISGDPTYITSYNNARALICRVERDELLEELTAFYVHHNGGM